MIDHASDAIPWIAKAKEGIYQFVMFGMTAPQVVETKVVVTAIVIGVGSSFAASYVNAERNAVRLDATISQIERNGREQEAFRNEMRGVITQRVVFEQIMAERVAILEATMRATHPQLGMGMGMNGNGKK
jgi:hypothetical protein